MTDGSNDGGIDFVYYDEDEAKVILSQSKYTGTLSFNDVIAELDKMHSTLQNFRIANTGSYNERLKKVLQNALDRLPDENTDNIEYNLFTTAPIDVEGAIRKIDNTQHGFSSEAVKIFTIDDVEKEIKNSLEALDMVSYEKIKLDKSKNVLEYESSKNRGIMCNVLSTSIIQLYNKYAGKGLFDLNIRKYIRNKLIDSGIKATLDKDRENFWFLNNGIIIACQDFDIDGDTVKLYDFSIVNGGQTTTLISTYKGSNTKEFYLPCKIISTKDEKAGAVFFTKIAEATNSQKSIYARDLKSNTPEMLTLKRLLAREEVFLEIKRGVKQNKNYKYSIKNDELAQLILSFAYQRPGTSRNGKQKIFDNELYSKLFKVNYFDDKSKKGFLLDIIDLYDRFKIVEKKYKQGNLLTEMQLEILKNGRQVIFALMGVVYRLENGDLKESDLQNNPSDLKAIPFNYGKYISNYKGNDFDSKLEAMIVDIIKIVADSYQMAYKNKLTTSVSNYLKTDTKYYDEIVPKFVDALSMLIGQDLKYTMDIFKRTYTNMAMVLTYWNVGRRIVEEEQQGEHRAAYGKKLLSYLSDGLTQEFGSGFSERNLRNFRKFYLLFPDTKIWNTCVPNLNWSHFRILLRVEDDDSRIWYMKEAASEGWSVRTLDRNIGTQYYYRLLRSPKKENVIEEMKQKTEKFQKNKLELLKSPIIAEFLGFKNKDTYLESDLETAILSHIRDFLMELGKGFAFVGRQQHIVTDTQDYYIDLVFYNIELKCYVLVDLKMGTITHQDVGQIDMYVRMYDELKCKDGDNPTIGILLCSETSEDIARYSVLHGNERLFMSKYLTYLPTEEQLGREIERQKEIFYMQHPSFKDNGSEE